MPRSIFALSASLIVVLSHASLYAQEARSGSVDSGVGSDSAAPTPETDLNAASASSGETKNQAANDSIVLKNGALVRGTITELVPNSHVMIMTTEGATRRFEMGEVKYAGPSQGAPPVSYGRDTTEKPETAGPDQQLQDPGRVLIQTRPVSVTFAGQQEGLTFHLLVGSSEQVHHGVMATPHGHVGTSWLSLDPDYKRVCTAPCTATLGAGTHEFGLSYEGGAPVKVPELISIDGPVRLTGDYDDNSGIRTAGWIVMFGGLAAGIAIGISTVVSMEDTPNMGGVIASAGLMVLSPIIGLVLTASSDDASIRIEPLSSPR